MKKKDMKTVILNKNNYYSPILQQLTHYQFNWATKFQNFTIFIFTNRFQKFTKNSIFICSTNM